MIDYIEIEKYLDDKDTPRFDDLEILSMDGNGARVNYVLDGCRKLEITYSGNDNKLTIAGSIAYFMKGHNFSCTRREFNEGIEHISKRLGVDLWSARVRELEYGTIFPVDEIPKQIIKNHVAGKGTRLYENIKGKDAGHYKNWQRSYERLKMYDAKRNVEMKQTLNKRKEMEKEGYEPDKEFLKFEMHLYNVTKINGNKVLRVEELTIPRTIKMLNEELMKRYKLLAPTKEVIEPSEKSECQVLNIVLAEYVKMIVNNGGSIEMARKELNNAVDSYQCLNKYDKDNRKDALRKAFKKMHTEDKSPWDLTGKIQESLSKEK